MTSCPSGASPIWHAIIIERDVLKESLIRCVSDGRMTEILHDIPRGVPPCGWARPVFHYLRLA